MRDDVKNVADKLRTAAAGLPAQEQNVLDWLVDRARKGQVPISDEDLRHASGGGALAGSLGWSDVEAEDLNIGWSKGIHFEEK
jgi:hypothetical protein